MGHADEIRAVRQTLSIRDAHLLENVERERERERPKALPQTTLHSQLRTGGALVSQHRPIFDC